MFEDSNNHQGIGIVGAGLVGCLTALAFASKGFSVTLFELRSDPAESTGNSAAKSINLAVSDRGIRALKYVDEEMTNRLMEHVIPMTGRMIHKLKGDPESQVYGLFGESINSIDRGYLNEFLLEEIRHSGEINVLFNHKLEKIENLSSACPKLTFTAEGESKSFEFDYIVGCDGSHSQFRYQLQKSMRMNISQEYIDMQYMELVIPAGSNGEHQIDTNHLHIWPRNEHMLIALPNKDGSFTSTFFSPWSLVEGFRSAAEFVTFFKLNFPDATKLLGEEQLSQVFTLNPRGSLLQVNAYPYHNSNGRALIIGDAAHSMVPFYGQGMNCGFEDARILMELIEENNYDVLAAFKQYSVVRKADLDTISRLALANYHEMSLKVVNRFYLLRKQVDYYLGKYLSGGWFQWIPMYTMISFRGDIPYSKAVEIEHKQAVFLNNVQLGIWGTAAVYGLIKAIQLWDKYTKQ